VNSFDNAVRRPSLLATESDETTVEKAHMIYSHSEPARSPAEAHSQSDERGSWRSSPEASSFRIKIGSEGGKSLRVGDGNIAVLWRYSFLQWMAGRAGWSLAAAALVAFANDLISFAQTGTYRVIPAGQVWFDIHVASLNLMQAVVQRFLHPLLWDPVIATMLQWPAWSLLGAPAAVFIAIAANRGVRAC